MQRDRMTEMQRETATETQRGTLVLIFSQSGAIGAARRLHPFRVRTIWHLRIPGIWCISIPYTVILTGLCVLAEDQAHELYRSQWGNESLHDGGEEGKSSSSSLFTHCLILSLFSLWVVSLYFLFQFSSSLLPISLMYLCYSSLFLFQTGKEKLRLFSLAEKRFARALLSGTLWHHLSSAIVITNLLSFFLSTE